MGKEVTDKIVFEYERFYLECMSQSKTGIFARSREIELKKNLMLLFKNAVRTNEETEEKLLALDNVLDEVYRYVKDYRDHSDVLEKSMRKWMESF